MSNLSEAVSTASTHHYKDRRPRRDRGAIMVEAAFIFPALMVALAAIIDGSFLLSAHQGVEDVVGDGARTGAIASSDPLADERILDEVERRVTGMRRAGVDRIVVYRAAGPDSGPPAICTGAKKESSKTEQCNAYDSADFGIPAASLVCGWCPVDRDEDDFIGVWMRFEYESLTGLLSSVTLTDKIVLPMEDEL